jgi:P-type conjugative transfer protein TrbJ
MALPLAGALTGRSLAQMTVFDPANYQQNLLSAVRALEQINNQIRALQNQAQVILRMDQNLTQLDATIAPDLQRMLVDIQGQLQAGQGIAMQLQATQTRYDALFRERLSGALSSDDALRNAKARWEEEYAAFRRSALLQGQIGGSIETDTRLLGEAMMSSRNAHGALEVVQAGNELTGLGVKQSLALQGLLATKARAETLTRARDLATEDEARQRFKTFVGTGTAYKASQ